MKKIVALLLALVMVCGFMVSCGKETADTGDSSSKGGTPVKTTGKKIDLTVKFDTIGEASKQVKANVPAGKPHVINLEVDQKTVTLPIGTKTQLTYKIKPETAVDKSVYFESSNTDIAKVDKDGYVLGQSCGTAVITVRTNDQGFRRKVTVVVTQNSGDEKKAQEMIKLINDARTANKQEKVFASDNVVLNAAANQRALEEAVDMVNNKEKAMDDKRTDKKTSIFGDYDLFVTKNAALYVWGDYSKDTKKAYDDLVKNENNAKNLGITGDAQVDYEYISVGYFMFNDVTYWCILLAST